MRSIVSSPPPLPPAKRRTSRTCELAWRLLRFGSAALSSPSFSIMKADIHPDYSDTDIACACGAVYHTRSTKQDIKIGICAACHPFFTGEQKFVDTAGRVEKFARRYGSTKATRAQKS